MRSPAPAAVARVCAWCGDEIEPASVAAARPDEDRSHGMCARCLSTSVRGEPPEVDAGR
jgi:hypothetical protein